MCQFSLSQSKALHPPTQSFAIANAKHCICQRIGIWKLVEKYNALKQERRVVDRLELFNETTNYLNENNIHPYTNVIADEFQDFSNPELKFLRALVAEGKNDLFLTGDPIQRIYNGRKINFGAAGINVRGVAQIERALIALEHKIAPLGYSRGSRRVRT